MSGLEVREIHSEIFTLDDTDPTLRTLVWNLTTLQSPHEGSRAPEVSASISYLVGVMMIIIVVMGLIENGTVLFVYSRTRKLRQANMSFVIGLSLSDMGQTALNLPFVAVACFYKRWVFGPYGCMYIGFVTTWFGLSQISLLCVIALERYFIIVQQCRRLSASTTRTVVTIVGCFIYGGGWAVAPLVGWSEYKLVAGEISCSLSWTLKNDLFLSYILALFSFVWFLPLGIITFSYIRIAQMVFLEKRKRQNMRVARKVSKERKVAVTVLLMVGAFVISWTPYSVVALLTAFGDMSQASSGVYLIPAVFAKASIIWNPIIYIARHKEFRRACSRTKRHTFSWLSKYMVVCAFFGDTADSRSSFFSKSVFSDKSGDSCVPDKCPDNNDITDKHNLRVEHSANNGDATKVAIHRDACKKIAFPSPVCADSRRRIPETETEASSGRSSSGSEQTFYSCENVCVELNPFHNNCQKGRRCSLPACHLAKRQISDDSNIYKDNNVSSHSNTPTTSYSNKDTANNIILSKDHNRVLPLKQPNIAFTNNPQRKHSVSSCPVSRSGTHQTSHSMFASHGCVAVTTMGAVNTKQHSQLTQPLSNETAQALNASRAYSESCKLGLLAQSESCKSDQLTQPDSCKSDHLAQSNSCKSDHFAQSDLCKSNQPIQPVSCKFGNFAQPKSCKPGHFAQSESCKSDQLTQSDSYKFEYIAQPKSCKSGHRAIPETCKSGHMTQSKSCNSFNQIAQNESCICVQTEHNYLAPERLNSKPTGLFKETKYMSIRPLNMHPNNIDNVALKHSTTRCLPEPTWTNKPVKYFWSIASLDHCGKDNNISSVESQNFVSRYVKHSDIRYSGSQPTIWQCSSKAGYTGETYIRETNV